MISEYRYREASPIFRNHFHFTLILKSFFAGSFVWFQPCYGVNFLFTSCRCNLITVSALSLKACVPTNYLAYNICTCFFAWRDKTPLKYLLSPNSRSPVIVSHCEPN